MRVRQFTMKDAYSFDMDAAGLDVSYKKHEQTYCRIFDRCGLKYVVVDAHSGAMGGSKSQSSWFTPMRAKTWWRAARSAAMRRTWKRRLRSWSLSRIWLPPAMDKPELVHTPGMKTIEDVAKFLAFLRRTT